MRTARLPLAALLTLALLAAACASGDDAAEPAPSDTAAAAEPAPSTGAAETTPQDEAGWVGVGYPPLPEGLEELGGTLIVPPGTAARDADYGLFHGRTADGDVLFLSRLQGRTPDGKAQWQVIDAVELPPVEDDEWFVLQCRAGDHIGVAAIAASEDVETLTDIRRAWFANRATGSLDAIAPDEVTCTNEGAGV